MNITKRILSVFMVALMLFTVVPIIDYEWLSFEVSAYKEENGFKYNVTDDGKACISYYDFNDGNVVIPDTLGGYPVAEIEDETFYYSDKLESVIIPASINKIGGGAFSGCTNLSNVHYCGTQEQWDEITIEWGNEILSDIMHTAADEDADGICDFCNAAVKENSASDFRYVISDGEATIIEYVGNSEEITIPDALGGFNVTRIGENAFYECDTITTVIIPEGVTVVDLSAFSYCTNLKSVTFPEGLTQVLMDAFSYCTALERITLPEGVTFIDYGAFKRCTNLVSVSLPCSLESIGEFAFLGCSKLSNVHYCGTQEQWDEITIDMDNEEITESVHMDIDENGDDICDICYYDALPVITGQCGDNVYYTLDKNSGVLTLSGTGEMWDYSGNSVFSGNQYIKSVVIEDGIEHIGDYAFKNCRLLTDVVFGENVTSIGSSVFADCSSLKNINLPEGITEIGGSAFARCTGLTSFTVPEGVTEISGWMFHRCENLQDITIPASVTFIGGGAFEDAGDCPVNVYITDLTAWCNIEFEDDDGSSSSPFGAGGLLYLNGELVEHLVIPDGITHIAENHFRSCISLKSVTIPDGMKTIGEYAFSHCKNLESVNISKSVTDISGPAFYDCESLTNITSDEDNEYYSTDAHGVLFDKNQTALIRYPSGNKGETYIIPDGVSSICGGAFEGCVNLQNIIIPDSVTVIEPYAVSQCDNLTNVHYCGTQEQWNEIVTNWGNEDITDIVHMNTDENGDGVCDLCYSEDETTTEAEVTTSVQTETTEPSDTAPEESTFAEEETTETTSADETATQNEDPTTKPTTTKPVTTTASVTTTATTENETSVAKVKKPAKVKIKKPVSKKKKQIVVTWKAVKNVNGYQVAYSTSKKFVKKATKTKLIKKAKTIKTTLKKLKSGKKYFIKVRAYKTVNGKKVYGAWNKTVSVKVK